MYAVPVGVPERPHDLLACPELEAAADLALRPGGPENLNARHWSDVVRAVDRRDAQTVDGQRERLERRPWDAWVAGAERLAVRAQRRPADVQQAQCYAAGRDC